MEIGRMEYTPLQVARIKEYLLGGLTGMVQGGFVLGWPGDGMVAIRASDHVRIVKEGFSSEISWEYPYVNLPQVPLSPDITSSGKTQWLQIAILIADQTGLTADPEVMAAIERRVTEEVLEGKLTRGSATKVAESEGRQPIRKFAWSRDGQLAAMVAGSWRLATGEMAEVTDQWAILSL